MWFLFSGAASAIAYFKGKSMAFKSVLKPVPVSDARRFSFANLAFLGLFMLAVLWVTKKGSKILKKIL